MMCIAYAVQNLKALNTDHETQLLLPPGVRDVDKLDHLLRAAVALRLLAVSGRASTGTVRCLQLGPANRSLTQRTSAPHEACSTEAVLQDTVNGANAARVSSGTSANSNVHVLRQVSQHRSLRNAAGGQPAQRPGHRVHEYGGLPARVRAARRRRAFMSVQLHDASHWALIRRRSLQGLKHRGSCDVCSDCRSLFLLEASVRVVYCVSCDQTCTGDRSRDI